MKYPTMGNVRSYRVELPQLNGGVYASLPPHLIADNQLSDIFNMWYKDGRLQTRPGFVTRESRIEMNVTANFHVHPFKNGFAVFSYTQSFFECFVMDKDSNFVSRFDNQFGGEVEKEIVSVAPVNVSAESEGVTNGCSFVLLFFLKNGETRIFGYNESTKKAEEISPYVPTLLKNGAPTDGTAQNAAGVTLEPKNLLSQKYKCQYTTDGNGWCFVLPESIENVLKISVTYDDGEKEVKEHFVTESDKDIEHSTSKYTYWQETTDRGDGRYLRVCITTNEFWFTDENGTALENPKQARVANNVTATIENPPEGHLTGMQFATWFGGGSSGLSGGTRVFLSGDKADPSFVVWSSLNNPLYFPATNYAYVGDSDSPVTAFGKQSDMLVIFKSNEIYCMQYMQGSSTTDEQLQNQESIDVESAQALFPMYPIHPEIGCDCPETICLCDNRLVWLNSDGRVYGLFSNGQFNENNVRELSKAIEPYLLGHKKSAMQNACAENDGSRYYLFVDGAMYVLDYSSTGFSYYSSYSNDEKAQKMIAWYRWDITRDSLRMTEAQGAPFVPQLFKNDRHFYVVANANDAGIDYLCVLELKEREKDGGLYNEQTDIRCYFKTKQFDFGHAERLKRINPFYLQITGDEGKTLKLTYLNGNRECLDDYSPVMIGEALEDCAPMRITPNAVRVRDFGFRVECDGRMEVGSLTLNYAMMGTVR